MSASSIERLRWLMGGKPSHLRWLLLRDLLDSWESEQELREVALPYAAVHLEAWPDALRFAHGHWLAAALRGQDVPHLALVRSLQQPCSNPDGVPSVTDVTDPNDYWRHTFFGVGSFERVLALPALAELRHLDIPRLEGGRHIARVLAQATTLRLTQLTLSGAALSFEEVGVLAGSPWLSGLKTLSIYYPSGRENWLGAWLERWPHPALEELTLVSGGSGAKALSTALGAAKGLRSLQLRAEAEVTPAVIRALPRGLRSCAVSALEINDAMAAAFEESAAVAELEELELRASKAVGGEDGLPRVIAALGSGLRSLMLSSTPSARFFDALLQSRALPGLRSLDISGCGLKEGHVPALVQAAPRLERLDISYSKVPAADLHALAKLPLRSLELDQVPTDDDALKALATIPTLEDLKATWCPITSSGWQELALSPAMSNLRSLKTWTTEMDDAAVAALLSSPHLVSLESIGLSVAGFGRKTHAVLRGPSRLPALRELVTMNRLSLASARALCASPLIEQLDELRLPGSYDVPEDAKKVIARSALPDRFKNHVRPSSFGHRWSLREVLTMAPGPEALKQLPWYLEHLLPGEVEVDDYRDVFLRLERWWPAELAGEVRKLLAEKGIKPVGAA